MIISHQGAQIDSLKVCLDPIVEVLATSLNNCLPHVIFRQPTAQKSPPSSLFLTPYDTPISIGSIIAAMGQVAPPSPSQHEVDTFLSCQLRGGPL